MKEVIFHNQTYIVDDKLVYLTDTINLYYPKFENAFEKHAKADNFTFPTG